MAKKKEVKKSVATKSKASAAKKVAAKKSAVTKKATTPKKTAVTKKATIAKKNVVAKKVATSKSSATKKTTASKNSAVKKTTAKKTVAPKKAVASKPVVKTVSTKTSSKKKVKGYLKRDLEQFKKVILAKKIEIIEQLQNLKDQMMDSSTGQYVNESSPYSLHMAEQGTDAQEREKLYLWAQRESKFLAYLEDALIRIEEGTYGVCIGSIGSKEGEHLIPKDRLLAVPHTQHCVACKNKISKK